MEDMKKTNFDILYSFYRTYNYIKVKRAYKATLLYDSIYFKEKSDVIIKLDGDKLKLYLQDNVVLSHDLLNTIGFFFPQFDFDEKCAYATRKGSIFFFEGTSKIARFGVNIRYDIDDFNKALIINNFLTKDDAANEQYFNELVNRFDRLSEITMPELKEEVKIYLENFSNNKRIEDITSMELPLDWTNVFSGSEIVENEYCESLSDALIKSITNLGKVDIEYISEITKTPIKEVILSLKGSIYQNPAKWDECFYKGWETKDEYLTGQIKHKLDIAKEANKKYKGYFSDNVEALLKVLPKELSYQDIYISLGSPWVPATVIDDFIKYIAGSKKKPWWDSINYATKHDEYTGTWEIPGKSRYFKNVRIDKTYGTSRINALHILERTLNMKTITVYDEFKREDDPKKKVRVINHDETVLALEKQQLLIEQFKEWVWSDDERKKMLIEIYENKYCSNIVRNFDGSFLTFPTMNKDVELYDYQKNAVARIILTPNTLLSHEVGAGKTYVMCAAGMEMKRIGISKKNLYVVPNGVVSQWYDIFKHIYPDANILCVNPNNFKKQNREEILVKIRDEDYDGIIMAYSSFELIPISKEYVKTTIEEELVTINKLLKNAKKVTKQLNAKKIRLEKELEKVNLEIEKQLNTVYFNDLGINTLFLDEAHNYKNVPIDTKINRVLGINVTGSNACKEMMQKVHIVQRNNNGRGVVFATGTPITNSLTDIFVMQKYLQNGELNILDLNNFDSWIGMFAEKEAEFEIDVDTSTYRLATRFRKYHNMPELSALLANVSDFYKVESINEIPELDGYTDELIQKTVVLKDYLKQISERADKVRRGKVKRKEDNMLKITTDGRKAALDIRLIDQNYSQSIHSKVCRCIENVIKIYNETKESKSTQLIFCDTSTPKDGFNLYDDIKITLISMGIKESDIAFIHDAKNDKERLALFRKVQNGDIRILLGSTFKLGTGVNVQNKLIAIHHLDVPWRPSDMTQREGRILRKGNENKKVKIFRYITDGSFDAYSWQLLESKQRMINAVLEGNMTERMCKEVDDLVLSYAEVKALAVGSPDLKRRVEIVNDIHRYRLLQNKYIKEKQLLEVELLNLPKKIEKLEEELALVRLDKEYYINNCKKYTPEERKDYRELIYKELIDCDLVKEEKVICNYQGFDVIMPTNMIRNRPYVYLKLNNKYKLDLGMTDTGIIIRIDNFLDSLDNYINNLLDMIDKDNTRISDINEELIKDKGYYDIISGLKEELEIIDKKLGVKK